MMSDDFVVIVMIRDVLLKDKKTFFFQKCLKTTVKYGNGGIMAWEVFSFSGLGKLIRHDKHIKDKLIFVRSNCFQVLTNYTLR